MLSVKSYFGLQTDRQMNRHTNGLSPSYQITAQSVENIQMTHECNSK